MRVVELVLRRIKDDCQMADQITASKAIGELVHMYNDLALGTSGRGLYVVTGETYGSDFKNYISFLPANEQLRLMDRYLSISPRTPDEQLEHQAVKAKPAEEEAEEEVPETVEVRDNRRHRHRLILVVVCFMLVLFTLLVGAGVAIMFHNHALDNAAIKAFMDTASEMVKLIVNSSK